MKYALNNYKTNFGCLWLCTGGLYGSISHKNGASYASNEVYGVNSGDVVGVLYDPDLMQVSFHKNGVGLGPAFEDVKPGEFRPFIIYAGLRHKSSKGIIKIVDTPKEFRAKKIGTLKAK